MGARPKNVSGVTTVFFSCAVPLELVTPRSCNGGGLTSSSILTKLAENGIPRVAAVPRLGFAGNGAQLREPRTSTGREPRFAAGRTDGGELGAFESKRAASPARGYQW
jgi:hypothetical protein